MSGLISREKIAEIQRSVNIVDLISLYVPQMKKAGANYKALCPFHDEKTPSFMVNPARQIFRCFGCGAGGDIFKFVMLYEKVEFPESIRIIAERYGITVTYSGGSHDDQQEKTALYKANSWAAGYFHQSLVSSPENFPANAYARNRGLDEASVSRFMLGYCGGDFSAYMASAEAKGITQDELLKTGLVSRRETGELRMPFRNRLVFPIMDTRDRVVGFGARALDDSHPKYINTPETPLFSKGRLTYALNFARNEAAKTGKLLLMEGYTDVIIAHKFGFGNAVATLGTALTRDHVQQMRRYADTVIAVYDGDSAGLKASVRSLDFFVNEDISLRIATLPDDLDPCDFLIKHGPEKFAKALDAAEDLFSFKIRMAKAGRNMADINERSKAVDELLDFMAPVQNEFKRRQMLTEAADAFNAPEKVLAARLEDRYKASIRPARPHDEAEPAAEEPETEAMEEPIARMLAEEALFLMLSDTSLIPRAKEAYGEEGAGQTALTAVLKAVFKLYDETKEANMSALLSEMDGKKVYGDIIRIMDEGAKKGREISKKFDTVTDFSKRFDQWLQDLESNKKLNTLQNLRRQSRSAQKANQAEQTREHLIQTQNLKKDSDARRKNPATG